LFSKKITAILMVNVKCLILNRDKIFRNKNQEIGKLNNEIISQLANEWKG
jgi:hypothetical protein